MKHKLRKLMLAATAGLVFAGTSHALDYDFSGHLQNHNDTLLYSFTANGTSNVTLFSSSWDDGNFDPMLGLWSSDGNLISFQDDGHTAGSTFSNGVSYDHGSWDSYFSSTLNAGSYFVSLSTYNNFPTGSNLSSGFSRDQETPVPLEMWEQPANGYRGDYYEFHILGVEAAEVEDAGAVPEPSTFILLGAGFAGIGLAGRRARKQV